MPKTLQEKTYDYLIVGAGIIGLTTAYELLKVKPKASICIIDKEHDVAQHSSGRNSGILHAGFYYTADSQKAKHCLNGNILMKQFCKENDIEVKSTKKLVVTNNEEELVQLHEIKKRADANGVETYLISQEEAEQIEPNINTYKEALYSPLTASVNPIEVSIKLKTILLEKEVSFKFNTPYSKNLDINYNYIINTAGLYSDKIAQTFGLAKKYTLLPFKGIYMKVSNGVIPTNINIYPVPDLKFPFLGVHYTITSDNDIKIGPSASPAFWRENYAGFKNFNLGEFLEILRINAKLFVTNAFNYRNLALREIKYYLPKNLIMEAEHMVKNAMNSKYKKKKPGIRAQLYDKKANTLVNDFIIEHTSNSTHVLNIISPGFTCSFSLAKEIIEEVFKNEKKHD
ncbi:NAD(P)/FAD-dependent oxidoreductase [Pontimicrobium sp. MEBiC06410]